MMVPTQIFIIPQYLMVSEIGMPEHDLLVSIPGACDCIWNISDASGLYGTSQRSGGCGQAGWM